MGKVLKDPTSKKARVVELVDTQDLKSLAAKAACRFDSGPGHKILRGLQGHAKFSRYTLYDIRKTSMTAKFSYIVVSNIVYRVKEGLFIILNWHRSCCFSQHVLFRKS